MLYLIYSAEQKLIFQTIYNRGIPIHDVSPPQSHIPIYISLKPNFLQQLSSVSKHAITARILKVFEATPATEKPAIVSTEISTHVINYLRPGKEERKKDLFSDCGFAVDTTDMIEDAVGKRETIHSTIILRGDT